MKKISILGSTGSIGTQALDIIAQNPNDFQIIALTTNKNIDLLEQQIKKFSPKLVAITDPQKAQELKQRLSPQKEIPYNPNQLISQQSPSEALSEGRSANQPSPPLPQILSGPDSLTQAATHPEADLVLTALVGAIGIKPTYEAIKSKKDIALANKETLVAAGDLIMSAAKEHNVKIIPVDSEHSAIFQCLEGRNINEVEKIILTCSGGPFHGKTQEELKEITPSQALKHPTWSMGAKISIDSATLANKGLEVIEAHYLFGLPPEKIEVVIHPQSIIHSMVQFKDGNILAQMGMNDMRIPISYALYYPEKATNQLPRLPLPTHKIPTHKENSSPSSPLESLTFSQPDTETFPALSLAYQALKTGGLAPAIYNSTNEKAVQSFLEQKIPFLEIPHQIETALKDNTHQHNPTTPPTITEILNLI